MVGNLAYFFVADPTHAGNADVWLTDGSTASTLSMHSVVTDARSGGGMAALGGLLYFFGGANISLVGPIARKRHCGVRMGPSPAPPLSRCSI